MKARPTIVVLSGESGCGKTTLCTRVATLARARGLTVAGVLTPPRLTDGRKVGLDVEDIRSGLRRPLAEPCAEPSRSSVGGTDGPATESWDFHANGLAWGAMVLHRATPCDLLVIDELGPLELVRSQGWMIGLDVLRGGRCRLAMVAVRPSLLLRFGERPGDVRFTILTVTRANRDDLAGRPSLASSQVPSPTTGRPSLRAKAISERVPNSPPTAMTADAVRTMMTLRASPIPVTMGISTCGLASAALKPGSMPIVSPPADLAPRQAATITPPMPPQMRIAPASAR
jgi:nucleoside-triphosphatase THEP1